MNARFFDDFSCRILSENVNIFHKKLTNRLFLLRYDVKNFIFSFKYRQRKVYLYTSKKSLVFITVRHKKFHRKFKSSYRVRKFHIYTRIRICGKMLLSYIFVWRKVKNIWYFRETETYENERKYELFHPFHKFSSDENDFFHAVW